MATGHSFVCIFTRWQCTIWGEKSIQNILSFRRKIRTLNPLMHTSLGWRYAIFGLRPTKIKPKSDISIDSYLAHSSIRVGNRFHITQPQNDVHFIAKDVKLNKYYTKITPLTRNIFLKLEYTRDIMTPRGGHMHARVNGSLHPYLSSSLLISCSLSLLTLILILSRLDIDIIV